MRRRRRDAHGPFEVEREEIEGFVERQVSSAEAFLAVVGLSRRKVSPESMRVAQFLKGKHFWDRAGCVGRLMEVEREFVKRCGPGRRERIVEEIEAKFEAYHKLLEGEGYL